MGLALIIVLAAVVLIVVVVGLTKAVGDDSKARDAQFEQVLAQHRATEARRTADTDQEIAS